MRNLESYALKKNKHSQSADRKEKDVLRNIENYEAGSRDAHGCTADCMLVFLSFSQQDADQMWVVLLLL